MKNKLIFFVLACFLLFSCASSNTPDVTAQPVNQIQDDCNVCFNVYTNVANGHSFIQIIDKPNNLVCWEDAGYVVVKDANYSGSYDRIITSYAPVLSCVKTN